MPLVRVLSVIVLAAVLGAGVAYVLVELIHPDEPQAVAPVVIDPAAGTQRTTATATTPRRTTTTRPSTTTTDDHGWEAGPAIATGDDSGKGRGRGRGRGGGGGGSSGGSGGGHGGNDD